MPNWVNTKMTVTGPKESLAAFKAKAASSSDEDGNARDLSFDPFIPMPKSLHVESGSIGEFGDSVFNGGDISRMLAYPWVIADGVTDREGLKLLLDQQYGGKARELAAIYKENREKYGHTTWYDWSVANWGTKWDACHSDLVSETDEELVYTFDTAWSPAEPVLEAMSVQFPDLTFTAIFDEESREFYYEAVWENGERVSETELEHEDDEEYEEDEE